MIKYNELLFVAKRRLEEQLPNMQIFPSGLVGNGAYDYSNLRIKHVDTIENAEESLNRSNNAPTIFLTWLGNGNSSGEYTPQQDCKIIQQFFGVFTCYDYANPNNNLNKADEVIGYLDRAVIKALHGHIEKGSIFISPIHFYREGAPVINRDKRKILSHQFIFTAQCAIEKLLKD